MARKRKIHIMVASTVYHNRDLLLQICGTDRAPNPKFVKECLTEHIFPKKWQTTNYYEWDKKDAQAYLDTYPQSDWVKDDIEKHEKEFKNRIVKFLNENLNLVKD